jgi:iron-sulfur cluster repair protein YtfE (RIC family)
MTNTANLERQHQDFFDLISKIAIHKSEQQVKDNASTISLLLSQLSGKLKIHIISEDKFLYPSLKNSTNPTIKTTSQAFYAEMGGLSQVFGDLKINLQLLIKSRLTQQYFLLNRKKFF